MMPRKDLYNFYCLQVEEVSKRLMVSYVLPDSQWNGVSCSIKRCPPRFSSQELHVSFKNCFLSKINVFLRIDAHFLIKITDFGLSEDVERNYFRQDRETVRLPIKWMAPEG